MLGLKLIHISKNQNDDNQNDNNIDSLPELFVDESFYNIAQSTTVWLQCLLHNFRMICQLTWMCWTGEVLRDFSSRRSSGGLLNRLFRRRSKKTSKLRVTGLCEENSPVTGEFPAQRASNAQNVSIWWRHYVGCAVQARFCEISVPNGSSGGLSILLRAQTIPLCHDIDWPIRSQPTTIPSLAQRKGHKGLITRSYLHRFPAGSNDKCAII